MSSVLPVRACEHEGTALPGGHACARVMVACMVAVGAEQERELGEGWLEELPCELLAGQIGVRKG